MKVTKLKTQNLRSFQDICNISFSDSINILIGPNNSGKSTILYSIFLLQRDVLNKKDITLGKSNGIVELYFKGSHPGITPSLNDDKIIIDLLNGNRHYGNENGDKGNSVPKFPAIEPNNLIYPYLSKRKVPNYSKSINETNTNAVEGTIVNLYSKIDRLITPQFQPGNREYLKACNDILGFEVSTLAKDEGKQAVYFMHNSEHIPLTAMGEGVANILGLITDLCVAEDKIFIIEEPENDIHPKALKSLLNFILEKSNLNQFFISTHSNIVMKHLGASENAKIFKVSNDEFDANKTRLKKSQIIEVPNIPIERQKVLEELGYDFFDLGLWKAWLFLEESSAEVIIRECLIRWFTPTLKSELRTFSAGSISQVKPKFDDFNKLFVFLHLEPTYKNKVWVYIDDGEQERKIISEMRKIYSRTGWNKSNFNNFSQHDFEIYYPKRFQEEVERILSLGKQDKRNSKRELLNEVKKWIDENDDVAKSEFKESASEVIQVLKTISRNIGV